METVEKRWTNFMKVKFSFRHLHFQGTDDLYRNIKKQNRFTSSSNNFHISFISSYLLFLYSKQGKQVILLSAAFDAVCWRPLMSWELVRQTQILYFSLLENIFKLYWLVWLHPKWSSHLRQEWVCLSAEDISDLVQ